MTFAAVLPALIGGASVIGAAVLGKGKNPKTKQLPTDTAEQKELKKAINEGVLKGQGPIADIFKGYSPEEFETGVRQPALKRYQEEILPQILEKYARNNRGFGSARLGAELRGQRNLESDLAEREYQARNSANQSRSNNILNALGIGVGSKGFENVHSTGYPSAAGNFASGISSGIGSAFGNYLGGLGKDYPQTQPAEVAVGGTH